MAIENVQPVNRGLFRTRLIERADKARADIAKNDADINTRLALIGEMEQAEKEGTGSAYATMMKKNNLLINILFAFISAMLDLIPYLLISSHISRELAENGNKDRNYSFNTVKVPNVH